MAIRVPGGHAEIAFEYRTPGLTTGIMLSLSGLAMYAVYLLILMISRRRGGHHKAPIAFPEFLFEEPDMGKAFERPVQESPRPGRCEQVSTQNIKQSEENT